MITDGESNEEFGRLFDDAKDARESGIIIYAVGITDAINTNELSGITSFDQKQGESWWTSPSFVTVSQIAPQISGVVCKGGKTDLSTSSTFIKRCTDLRTA